MIIAHTIISKSLLLIDKTLSIPSLLFILQNVNNKQYYFHFVPLSLPMPLIIFNIVLSENLNYNRNKFNTTYFKGRNTILIALVVGASMGAQQTYEWAVRYPD